MPEEQMTDRRQNESPVWEETESPSERRRRIARRAVALFLLLMIAFSMIVGYVVFNILAARTGGLS